MATSWTGVRPVTLDEPPILGPVHSVRGFILNCGWGGTGIIQAPIADQLVAEYISKGYTETMDILPLEIERFKGKSVKGAGDLCERSQAKAMKEGASSRHFNSHGKLNPG